MAKKEKKEKTEKTEKSGKSNIIIIVLLVLILLGLTGFGAYYLLNKNKSASSQPQVQAKIEEAYLDLGEYTLNLSDTGSNRYIKTKISVAYDKTNKNLATEATADLTAIRAAGLEYLESKKASDFRTENLQQVKKELIDTLNKKVTQGQFTNIYFQDLLIQ